jgi:uncharacterized protein
VLARHPKPVEWNLVLWNACDLGSWARVVDGADVIINLAGRSVNCRYNSAHQREIKNSRTIATGLIGQAIAQAAHPPPLWLNASTATIYRHALDRPMDETTGEVGGSEPGAPVKWNFSVDVATSWERALFAAETPHTRKIAMRSAMVMSPDPGGIFDSLLHLVRLGFGGTLGSGQQFVSWIHELDFERAVEFLIRHEQMGGVVNLCSPHPVCNRDFMRCLRNAWCTRYVGIPASKWMLEIGAVVLRTETELILKSRRVVPGCLLASGFDFHFPNWRPAAQDLVHRWRELNEH